MPVDSQHAQYQANAASWKRARDAAAGQDAVHAAREGYLPKLSEQTQDEYDAYLLRALYYGATGRTVDGLSGLVFRRAPAVEIPPAGDYLKDDIDTAGTPLTAACEKVVDELLIVGRIGILTDYPRTPGVLTQADEAKAGVRSFATTYCCESIWNWRIERVNNKSIATMVTLYECVEEPVDEYETKSVEQWRILRLVGDRDDQGRLVGTPTYIQELWRKNKTAGAKDKFYPVDGYPITPLMNNAPMSSIPFDCCGPMGIEWDVKKPPIRDLADVNISHYQSTADYEHGLKFTALPTAYVTGHGFKQGEKIGLGGTTVIGISSPLAKLGFLEFTGQGLTQIAARLAEKEQNMAALGARMLGAEKRAAETAETAAIHRSGENSVLASLAIAASSLLTRAVQRALDWSKIPSEAATVKLNTDYLAAGLDSLELTALVGAWQAGAISKATLYDNLQRGEIARQDVDFDQEEQEINDNPPLMMQMQAAAIENPPAPPAGPPAPAPKPPGK